MIQEILLKKNSEDNDKEDEDEDEAKRVVDPKLRADIKDINFLLLENFYEKIKAVIDSSQISKDTLLDKIMFLYNL